MGAAAFCLAAALGLVVFGGVSGVLAAGPRLRVVRRAAERVAIARERERMGGRWW